MGWPFLRGWRWAFLALLTVAPLAAEPNAGPGAAPLGVGVSVAPLAWLVEQVGGPRVAVQVLAKPGDSAETFQPGDAQVSALLRSRVFFRIGLPFESSPAFQALLQEQSLQVVDLRQDLDLLVHHHGAPHGAESHVDPHYWLSPRRMVRVTERVAEVLTALAPADAAVFRQGQARAQRLLQELDLELAATFEPYRGRAFLVHHPEWSYFAADYGLRQFAVEHDGKEPTEFELTRLMAAARATGQRVIFRPPQLPARGSYALAEALGAQVVLLDALDPDLPNLLRRGAAALKAALDAERPTPYPPPPASTAAPSNP